MLKINNLTGFSRVIATAVAPLDPNEIPSIWASYEADSFSQADGSTIVTAWGDSSGNGRTATIAGIWTYETNELNGLPVLRSSVPDASFTPPSMAALTEGSSIEVCKVVIDLANNGGSIIGSVAANSHYPYSNGLIYDTFGTTARKDAITPVVTMTNWHTAYWWSAANDWGLQQNGINAHTTSSNTVGFSATPKVWANGGNAMKGDLAARYFFSAKLTSDQLAGVRAFILNKWGV